MKRSTFLFQLHLYNFLGVVPCAARVGHKDGLIKAEGGDRNQVADEEERLDKGKGQGGEKHSDEDVQHALLGILGADFHNLFAVGHRCLGGPVQFDRRFNELHRAVGARGDGLGAGAGKPVNHGAAGNKAQHKRRVQKRELGHIRRQSVGERHDDGEDHRGGAHHRGADQNRLGGGLERIARTVVGLQHFFGQAEIHVHVIVPLEFLPNVRNLFDLRKLIDRLRVVRHRAVGIHSDGHRAHAQKTEGHQPKCEHGRSQHQISQTQVADQGTDGHQQHHRESQIIGGEVTGHKAGKDPQRRAAFLRRNHHLFNVPRFGGGENFYQFRNDGARQRPAGNDSGQLPPLRGVATQFGNDDVGDHVSQPNRNNGSEPHKGSEGRFEIHLVRVGIPGLGDGGVHEISQRARHQHHDAHDENPHKQLHLYNWIFDAQQDEGDQRDTCHAIGLKAVGARSYGIAGVVARAVRDHARVARVVFLDFKFDFHQVGADVRNLGKDAARDAQGRCSQRFAYSEPDKAHACVVSRNKKQDDEHHQQLNADQHHANAHAGLKRDLINRKRLAAEAGKRRARIGIRVHANAKPRHAVTSRNADYTEQQNNAHTYGFIFQQDAKIKHDDDGNEDPKKNQELALRYQVGFASLVNQMADFFDGLVDGKFLKMLIGRQPKKQPEDAEYNPKSKQGVPIEAQELDLG